MNRYIQIVAMAWIALVVIIAVGVRAGFGGSGAMTGAYSDVDKNDETVQKVMKFVIEELQKKDNSLYASRLGDILRVQSQVVSGAMYKITFTLEYTNCRVGSHGGQQNIDSESCAATKRTTCTAKVWYQAWLKPAMQLMESNCGGAKAV